MKIAHFILIIILTLIVRMRKDYSLSFGFVICNRNRNTYVTEILLWMEWCNCFLSNIYGYINDFSSNITVEKEQGDCYFFSMCSIVYFCSCLFYIIYPIAVVLNKDSYISLVKGRSSRPFISTSVRSVGVLSVSLFLIPFYLIVHGFGF